MTCMTLTRLAMACAALLLAAATATPSQAASAVPPAAQSAIGQPDSGLVEIGRRHGHYRRHHHRHGGGLRFFFAPVIVGGGYYGYDRYRGGGYGGPSCYSICREYRGPEFCRYNWRRYC